MSEQQQQSQLPPHSGGEEEGQALAAQIAENPERLRKRLDVAQVLDGMRKGVLIELRIRRPRFTVAIAGKKKTSTEMSGLEKLGLALSDEAHRVLYDYFSLGRHSLLPREWQEQLNVAETGARQCLAEHSIKTHWGAFVPAASYQRWLCEAEPTTSNCAGFPGSSNSSAASITRRPLLSSALFSMTV